MAIVVGDPHKMKTEEVLKEFFAKIAEEHGYQRRPYTNEMAKTNKVSSLFRRYKRHWQTTFSNFEPSYGLW